MRSFKPFLILMVLMMALTYTANAQKNFTKEADNAFEMKMYYEAIDLYKKAYSKTTNQVEKRRILFQMAESYRLTNNIRRAEFGYLRAIRSRYTDPIVHLRYGEVLLQREKYEDAIEQFKKYKEKVPDDPRADVGIESAEAARDWVENPTRYEVEADRRINDKESDFAPMYADRNYKTVVFASTRKEATGKTDPNTGQVYSDLFITEIDKRGNWSRADLIDEDKIVNTSVNEGAVFFDRRFNTMYFTRCPMEKGEVLGCKIYFSKKRGRTWSDPELVKLGPDTFTYGHPTLTKDERTIIFSSDMDGGSGGKDLWMATRRSSSRPFGEPVNLGSTINTSGDEMYPYLFDDNTLYFASDGHVGLGGLDIFKVTKEGEEWGEPVNMKAPINSHVDDFGITFNKDQRALEEAKAEEMGFFTTNRRGGRGGDDLWRFRLPEIVFTISGTVRNDKTLQLMPDVAVTMTGGGKTIETKTDDRGRYNFNKRQVDKNTTYELSIIENGFMPATKQETTVGRESSTDLVVNFRLEPIPPDPIPLPEIRFALDKHELQEQYKDSLNGLIKTMKDNPQLVVELGSHTDFRADAEYNDTLSLRRAKSIVDYLISQGIEDDRLVPKGYGERMPRELRKDITIDGYTFSEGTTLSEEYIKSLRSTRQREAAHQLNRRTTFKILRTDYVPSQDKVEDLDSTLFGNIVLNPEENIINLQVKNDAYIFPVITNGVQLVATYQSQSDAIYISFDQAMDFLSKARITVDNFTNGEEAIKEDGDIVENAEVVIDNVRIANKELEDVKMIVTYDQELPLIIGKTGLQQFGSFTIDEDKNQLIFEQATRSEPQEE
ncbi:MAG: OmpA family protein [Bacteroidota bacterium]